MPTLRAAFEAAGLLRARRVAAAARHSAKGIVQAGPLLSRSSVGRPLAVARDWPADRAIERFFKSSALVYRPVMSLATAVGSVRWQVEILKGEDAWETAPQHALQALLDKPHEWFSRQDWNETLVLYLVLTGNALFEKTLASGRALPGATKPRILEMTPLIPNGIQPVPGGAGDDWVQRYEYRGPPKKTWQPEELLHFMLRDPSNLYWGMSPLQAASSLVLMDLKAVRWNLESMDNRAVVDGVYTTKTPLSTPQYEELLDQLYDQHTGPDRAHLPMVVGGADWTDNARNAVEMDFVATRKSTREEILSDLYTPPVMAGFFDDATLANAEVSRRLFWEDNLIPAFVERIVGGLNHHIVPHFGTVGKLRIRYDISGIPALRDDLRKKVDMLRVLTASGTPYNQAILELEIDLAPIEVWGDLPFGLEQFRASIAGGGAGDPAALPIDPFAAQPGAQPAAAQPAQPAGGTQQVEVSTAAVLNGAQITAATAIVQSVASGTMPRDAGIGQLQVLFNLTLEQAEQIMGSAGTGAATTPNPNPAAQPTSTPDAAPAKGRRLPAQRKVAVTTGTFATDIADAEAPAIRRAVLAVLQKMREGASLEELTAIVRNADAAAALQKLGAHRLPGLLSDALGAELRRTATNGANLAARQLTDQLGASLELDSNRLATWLKPYTHQRVQQLVATTEHAARDFFAELNAGKLGDNAEAAAKVLNSSWGLHRQQASGVRNVYKALLDQGKAPGIAAAAADDLAKRLLSERAANIGQHEALVAANRGNGAAWEQVAADGIASSVAATWYVSATCKDPECLSLDGVEIDVGAGERFVGESGNTYREPPEPHPFCECGLLMSAVA